MSVQLIQGDAAAVLSDAIAPGSVNMVYADPPFGNEQVWTGAAGAFSDKWRWSRASAEGWAALRTHSPAGAYLMAVAAQEPKARAYLGVMAGLLLGVFRVLDARGTLWLHFDDTMGAHLRLLGDVVFGTANQFGTVIWHRSSGRVTPRSFARVHDTIACWGRTRAARFRLARLRSPLVFGDPCFGILVDGLVDDRLAATANERVGYPTQKPLSLLRRFIEAASLPGDVVLDPCCGSGTSLVAAKMLGRKAIGVDMSADAIAVARSRLFPPPPAQRDLFEPMA